MNDPGEPGKGSMAERQTRCPQMAVSFGASRFESGWGHKVWLGWGRARTDKPRERDEAECKLVVSALSTHGGGRGERGGACGRRPWVPEPRGRSSMAEPQSSKLATGVRFSSPARNPQHWLTYSCGGLRARKRQLLKGDAGTPVERRSGRTASSHLGGVAQQVRAPP